MATLAAAEGFDRIAAAGGDGSIAAVAAGLALSPHSSLLGVIPMGTGNDFARGLGIPLDVREALDALSSPRSRPIDLIRCRSPQIPGGESYSINAVVGGLGGRIGDRMTPELSKRWGRLSYLRAGAGELFTGRSCPVVVSIDGNRFSMDCLMLVVANGRFAGGAIDFAPAADPGDGELNAVAVTAMPKLALLRAATRILRGRVEETPGVLVRTGREIEIEAGPSFWFNLDGETWVAGSARFDVMPGVLEVVVV
jgi:YegS/Rv2252/BmrU family lipid kinase